MRGFLGLLMCLCLLDATAAKAEGAFAANDVDFLNMMGNLEGPRGFGTISDFAPSLPAAEIDTLTIGAVLDYQRAIRAQGTKSSAVGRYQYIYTTLSAEVASLGISQDIIFDGEVQTFLARSSMQRCGFYEVDRDTIALGNCLSAVWAALPRLSGPAAGLSTYEGDGLNHALVSQQRFIDVLESRFAW